MKKTLISVLVLGVVLLLSSCKEKTQVLVDGSSTVFPITEAVAEEYRGVDSSVNVTVGTSGTGGGFKKFCNGEIQISDASRPIKKEENEKCAEKGIEFVEIPVAYDGLAVLVNPKNEFANELTTADLKKIFNSEGYAKTWKEVNPKFPAEPIKIYAPGKDSGTFDYFVEEILGKKAQVRPDATFSEDDNVLVTGIAGDQYAIGFFGLAYYEENKDKLKLVSIVNPKTNKGVQPSLETVISGDYAPLSRPLFIYVSKTAAEKEDVKGFVNYYLKEVKTLSKDVGYIPLGDEVYTLVEKRFSEGKTGTVYTGDTHGKTLVQLYQ